MSDDTITIKTNNVPRLLIDAWDLTVEERAEFDYLDWEAIGRGEATAEFFRYKGELYDYSEVQTTSGLPEFNPLRKWDGYLSDSFFSGIVVRYSRMGDEVTIGRFYS